VTFYLFTVKAVSLMTPVVMFGNPPPVLSFNTIII